MRFTIRKRANMRRPAAKRGDGAVVWTLGRGVGAALAQLPPLKSQGAVEYLSGGGGRAEAEAIRHVESKFPLVLEFVRRAAQPDESITDVDVNVIDAEGHSVLVARSDGPYLLARLRDGAYTVQATYFGHRLEKTVRVAAPASAHAVFVWDMKL